MSTQPPMGLSRMGGTNVYVQPQQSPSDRAQAGATTPPYQIPPYRRPFPGQMPTPASGWGYPVMGQPTYGGGGATQPLPRYGGYPPPAGYAGARNYPTPGNTYPIYGEGQRPGFMNPAASYGSPYQTPQPQLGGGSPYQLGGGGNMYANPQPRQAFDAMSQRRY